jgi:hypothetical protein
MCENLLAYWRGLKVDHITMRRQKGKGEGIYAT